MWSALPFELGGRSDISVTSSHWGELDWLALFAWREEIWPTLPNYHDVVQSLLPQTDCIPGCQVWVLRTTCAFKGLYCTLLANWSPIYLQLDSGGGTNRKVQRNNACSRATPRRGRNQAPRLFLSSVTVSLTGRKLRLIVMTIEFLSSALDERSVPNSHLAWKLKEWLFFLNFM